MINPIGRTTYQGYIRADAPLEEEDEESQQLKKGGSSSEEEDLERGTGRRTPSAKSQGKRRVGAASSRWDGNSSEMNVLRPNIHKDDEQRESSDDDEVPHDFMVEAAGTGATAAAGGASKAGRSGKTRRPGSGEGFPPKPPVGPTSRVRGQPLYSVAGSSTPPPLLPTANPRISQPPKPSELDAEERSSTPRSVPRAPSSLGGRSSSDQGTTRHGKGMRGLDEYEKALWNWVNVYNLDAFLQDVYSYYEGNGIYSIALSRGLNLLCVHHIYLWALIVIDCDLTGRLDLLSDSPPSCWDA